MGRREGTTSFCSTGKAKLAGYSPGSYCHPLMQFLSHSSCSLFFIYWELKMVETFSACLTSADHSTQQVSWSVTSFSWKKKIKTTKAPLSDTSPLQPLKQGMSNGPTAIIGPIPSGMLSDRRTSYEILQQTDELSCLHCFHLLLLCMQFLRNTQAGSMEAGPALPVLTATRLIAPASQLAGKVRNYHIPEKQLCL